jgi:hypothetical protein
VLASPFKELQRTSANDYQSLHQRESSFGSRRKNVRVNPMQSNGPTTVVGVAATAVKHSSAPLQAIAASLGRSRRSAFAAHREALGRRARLFDTRERFNRSNQFGSLSTLSNRLL